MACRAESAPCRQSEHSRRPARGGSPWPTRQGLRRPRGRRIAPPRDGRTPRDARLQSPAPQGFPSGQRGRAVNPLAQPSEVRILLPAQSWGNPWFPHEPSPSTQRPNRLGLTAPARARLGSRSGATLRRLALLAQSVEHLHGKEGVDGSSPSEGSARFRMVVGVAGSVVVGRGVGAPSLETIWKRGESYSTRSGLLGGGCQTAASQPGHGDESAVAASAYATASSMLINAPCDIAESEAATGSTLKRVGPRPHSLRKF